MTQVHLTTPTLFALVVVAGLLGALALSRRTARLLGLPVEQVWDAGLFALMAAFVASRALLIAEHPRTFLHFPVYLLLQPSLTGFGLLLAALATFGYLLIRHISPWQALEMWTPPGLLLWASLALGHHLEGSDPGMSTTAWWGVHRAGPASEQPVALLVALAAAALAVMTLLRLRQGRRVAAAGLLAAGAVQFLASLVRQPAPTALGGLEPLEWVALGLMAVGTVLTWLNRQFGAP